MDIDEMNRRFSLGQIDDPRLFPHLERLKKAPYTFKIDFGLTRLPEESGILMVRGARQYGKSTWLEQELSQTIKQFGPGTAYYLNGDMILSSAQLQSELEKLVVSYRESATVRRLFIDEITTIKNWEVVLKHMADQGKFENILIVTTGSKATDLRRGAERLPGRKGKLPRTSYLFTPISYQEFHRVCHAHLKERTLISYLLSGGSPIACSEIASSGSIPEYVIELVKDWVDGEVASTGRPVSSLRNIMSILYRFGGNTVGQAKLAREAGLANNTVAANYIEILNDLGCVVPSYPWDASRKLLNLRKECKYHFTNLLVAAAYYSGMVRCYEDFMDLREQEQGVWYEWLIAQELLRRSAIQGEKILEPLAFWQSNKNEIDFVVSSDQFIEVKRGEVSAIEFAWFAKVFPTAQLTLINKNKFKTANSCGVTLEDFLLQEP